MQFEGLVARVQVEQCQFFGVEACPKARRRTFTCNVVTVSFISKWIRLMTLNLSEKVGLLNVFAVHHLTKGPGLAKLLLQSRLDGTYIARRARSGDSDSYR